MNNNDDRNRKLDILSGIDEEIIDKHTARRAELLAAATGRRRRQRLIALVAIAAALALMLASVGVMLLLPGDPDAGISTDNTTGGTIGDTVPEKQVPIYQGMTVSNTKPTAGDSTNTASLPNVPLAGLMARSSVPLMPLGEGNNGNNGNNGNHYGQNKRPVEDVVEDSLVVTGGLENVYYAKPGEDIYITIHFHNPDDFEIMSFTLNGSKYSSYMFESGSDMENLVLKYNVGDTRGILDLTIDAIKYIDGTEIKDVLIDGDKTVRVCVYPESQPRAEVKNVVVGLNDVTFTATVTDPMGLIALSGGKAQAIVSDGESIVASQDIPVGETTTVTLGGLDAGVQYEYAVVVSLDRMDGEGFASYVIAKGEFTTETRVAFNGVTVTQSGVSFGYVWNEDATDKTILSLALYRDEIKERDLDVGATSVGELLSNNTYELRATYTDNGETKTVVLTFTTEAKAAPEITFDKGDVTQDTLAYKYACNDPDGVIGSVKVELLHGDDAPVPGDVTSPTFTGLLSNNTYTVRLTYTYDLCDGDGEHTETRELGFVTKAKATPKITLEKGDVTQSTLAYKYACDDPDGVITDVKIELLHENGMSITGDVTSMVFTGLRSDSDYTVKLTYRYDLCDGRGVKVNTQELSYHTLAKKAPTITFSKLTSTRYTITGGYSVTDPDGVILSENAKVYKGSTAVSTVVNRTVNATGLTQYTDYTVTVTLTYDLGDGRGVQTVTASYDIRTAPHVDVKSVTMLTTDPMAIFFGDVICLQIRLDNPTGAAVSGVVVNGKLYATMSASTPTVALVEIVCDENSFDDGETELVVEAIELTADGKKYLVSADTRCSVSACIWHVPELVSVQYVNESFEPIEWAYVSDTVYVLITLDNPSGFTINDATFHHESFFVSGRATYELQRLTDDMYYFPLTLEKASTSSSMGGIIYSLTFGNEHLSDLLPISESDELEIRKTPPFVVIHDEVRYVSTADELASMENGYYYELTQDIDLSGINWTSKGFVGVFNGNGHYVRNLSFVGNVSHKISRLGLFSTFVGSVYDLHVENVTVIAHVTDTVAVWYGGIAAVAEGYVRRCSVTGSTVSLTTDTMALVGGIVGSGDSVILIISDCTHEGSLAASGESSSTCVGGIASIATTISGCTNYGTVSGTFAGGIAHSATTISDCTNHGTVSGTYAGGIVCRYTTVSDCINYGTVSGTYAGGIAYSATTISDCTNHGEVSGRVVADLVVRVEELS